MQRRAWLTLCKPRQTRFRTYASDPPSSSDGFFVPRARAWARPAKRTGPLPPNHPRVASEDVTNRPGPSTSVEPHVQSAVRDFEAAIWANSSQLIHARYQPLRTSGNGPSSASGASVTQEQMTDALVVLASSGTPDDMRLIETIIADMPTRFGLSVFQSTYHKTVAALCVSKQYQSAINLLTARPSRRVPSPTRETWHALLAFLADASEVGFMRAVIRRNMPLVHCLPDNATYRLLIRAIFRSESASSMESLKRVIDDMKAADLPRDELTLSCLSDGYANKWQFARAADIERLYQEAFSEGSANDTNNAAQHAVDRMVVAQVLERGWKAALKWFDARPDTMPSVSTIHAVVAADPNPDAVPQLESHWRLDAGPEAWAIVIKDAIGRSDLSRADKAYRAAIAHGVVPHIMLVHPLIRALLHRRLGPPKDVDVEQAFAIYRDLALAQPYATQAPEHDEDDRGPNAALYNDFLRAISSSPQPHKYFLIAQHLVEDMHDRRIHIDGPELTHLIVATMQIASTYDEAFNLYRKIGRAKKNAPDAALEMDPRSESDFFTVIKAFLELEPHDEPVPLPSVALYFDMMRDVRQARYRLSARAYELLLSRFNEVANRPSDSPEVRARICEALPDQLKQVHNRLKIDASVTPDAQLFNLLMDLYQKSGSYSEAYDIWKSMFRSRTFTADSVSIILSMCARDSQGKLLDTIWGQVRMYAPFELTLPIWNRYLECLCRLGRLEDALNVLCQDMSPAEKALSTPIVPGLEGPQPDAQSIGIVLATASEQGSSIAQDAGQQIRRAHPKLWDSLPNPAENGWSNRFDELQPEDD